MSESDVIPVRGHTCPKLEEWQRARWYVCVPYIAPYIDRDGLVSGRDDDWHPYPILYCPFCGASLGDAEWEEAD